MFRTYRTTSKMSRAGTGIPYVRTATEAVGPPLLNRLQVDGMELSRTANRQGREDGLWTFLYCIPLVWFDSSCLFIIKF